MKEQIEDIATKEGPLYCGFNVCIDQREKKPYRFAGMRADVKDRHRPIEVPTKSVHLISGDYTIDGMEHMVAIERKEKTDLYATLGQHRARFERELERLSHYDFAAVIVESEWSDVLRRPPMRSEMSPKTIVRSVMAWQVRFTRVHWIFLPGREVSEVWTFRLLDRFFKEQQKKKETIQNGGS